MYLKTKIHTIFLLIGPTECGKTTFAKEVLIPSLQFHDEATGYRTNVQYLSSDGLRQEVLGYPYDKYDDIMLSVSEQAFQLLNKKLDLVSSFPVNCDFAIVDTTGLSEAFREEIIGIARKNQYRIEAILFDYKNIRDHYASERSKRIIAQHLNRMRKEVLPSLKRKQFDAVHRINEKNFTQMIVDIENLDEYVAHHLPNGYQYVVIGDVHEQIEELKKMVEVHGFRISGNKMIETDNSTGKKLVLIGDYIDKGKNTKDTIEFLYENHKHFLFVKGNHENYVYNYLNGKLPGNTNIYFDSIPVFENDSEIRGKFEYLFSLAKDFYRSIGVQTPGFYLTHAPCEKKYLGKLDPESRRNQRKFATSFGNIEEGLEFLKQEAVRNHPFHVFGHIALKKAMWMKNKIGIDTGCVHGNELTSVIIDSRKPFFKSIRSQKGERENLPVLFSKQEKSVSLLELSDSDKKRLNYILRNKVNYISGTMSPADKDMEMGVLESLSKGLDYFRQNGVSEVVLQPKYMGSRCNVYLSENESYATSRNGFKITHVELDGIFADLLQKYSSFMKGKKVSLLVLDGELLPWRTLGKGLIDRQFQVVANAVENEISYLKDHGFEQAVQQLRTRYETSGYRDLKSKSSKKELMEKLGQTDYRNFKEMDEILDSYHGLAEHEKGLSVFKKQLDLFGHDGQIEFKAFSILKMVHEDGSERFPKMKTSEMYQLINGDTHLVLDLKEDDSYEKAEAFFTSLTTEQGMEGVVIKPEVYSSQSVPYLKVRNPEYLTLVYGYDYRFPHKYKKLLKQKSIGKKLKTSLNEHRLGVEMLKHKLEDISPENKEFQQVVANLLFEEKAEKEIDPRL